MKIRITVCVCLFVAASGVPVAAQFNLVGSLSGEVTPQIAAPGVPMTLTVTAFGGDVGVTGNSIIRAVHQGSPTGPAVFSAPPFSSLQIVFDCNTSTATWNQTDDSGAQVPAGDYWIRVQTSPATYFPLTIEASPAEPRLTALTTAQAGQTLLMQIDAPNLPNAPYITALSLTTNTGILVSVGEYLALDFDFLFDLSFPAPHPALFANLQGTLDASGTSSNGMAMFIPAVPGNALSCMGIAWQAAVFGPSGVELTNAVNLTIQ